jgi:hypothetical protein
MPHAMLRLVGGANTTETPALNENSGISATNLVRYFFDPNGSPLIGKLGGWLKYFPTAMSAIVRALWAWEDINDVSHLAIGTQPFTPAFNSRSQLAVITAGALTDITPVIASSDTLGSVDFATTIGSASVTITDASVPGITDTCSVFFPVQISVGGVVLFGLYPCDPDGYSGADSYTVYARDILGNLLPATTSASAVIPVFTATAGSNVISVALADHGYSVGITFPVLIEISLGGNVHLYGNYVIQDIVDANTFTILANVAAASSGGGTADFIPAIYNGLTPNPPSALPVVAVDDWTPDNFGQDLVACGVATGVLSPSGVLYQPIYIWSPQGQPTASVIPQAPVVNDGIFVAMPQRQIVAWGSTQTGIQDPLLINWCDVNNPYQWIALVTNQAGSYRIPKGSRIVAGVQGPQQALIWTDIDVWSMQYIGPPYVYSFNEIGTGCGLIGRKAGGALNGIYYWMGPSQFFNLGGEGVLPLPCPVWDVVFQNLYPGIAAANKIRFASNARFGEIQWFYPSANGTGEVDSYVKYNVYMGVWDYGSLGRTAWVDQSVLGPPIGADPASLYLYQHETSNDADGAPMLPYFQTGYFTIAEGDFQTFIDLIWPDMRYGQWSQPQTATVQITFYVVNYPGDTPRVFGPYSVTQATKYFNTRLRGRLVSIRISSSDLGSFWRIGALRYRYAPDGRF